MSVKLIEVHQHTGWAVFTECDGYPLDFVAYFAEKKTAEMFVEFCAEMRTNPEYESPVCIYPAGVDDEGTIVVAGPVEFKSFSDMVGIAAIVQRCGIDPDDAEAFRKQVKEG